ncbi:MAG: AraC family transcriptional regulator [Paenibacillus sp.]|jgi:two-component system response regulator YesN|nr:AraC family transcriptional regulator [Paenibacillus sp.]
MFHVLVAEDEMWIRKAIIEVIENMKDFKVIAEAGDGEEAWNLTREAWPNLIVTL